MRHLRLPSIRNNADLPTAIFGAWDGCVSTLAFLIADKAASAHLIATAGLGGALGAAMSMGSGQWEGEHRGTTGRTRRAVVMMVASLVGALLPVVGFPAGNKTAGFVVAIVLAAALAGAVGAIKHRTDATPGRHWAVDVGGTYALWAAVVVVAGAVSLV